MKKFRICQLYRQNPLTDRQFYEQITLQVCSCFPNNRVFSEIYPEMTMIYKYCHKSVEKMCTNRIYIPKYA